MISDQTQHLVSTVNDVNSLISSMNDSIAAENKSILVKRILTLSSYGDSSNAGPLGYINEMYLNYFVNLDFFDQISAKDQAGLLMEETSVGIKNSSGDNQKSFKRFTGYLRDQGAVGMITNLQSGMTLFLKPSGHCRAQMYSLSSQDFTTWSLVGPQKLRPLGLPRKLRPLGLPQKLKPLGLPQKFRPIRLRRKLRLLGSPL